MAILIADLIYFNKLFNMGKIKSIINKFFVFLTSAFLLLLIKSPVQAQGAPSQGASTTGQVIHVGSLDTLLWSVVSTIQFYTLPLMAIALVFFGVRLLISDDNPHTKSEIKGWMFKIIIGAFIIFGATTIASVLKNFLA